jgi:hypothetical protein
LLIFGLEEKAALVRVIFGTTEFDQMSPGGNALDADTSGEDIIQGNDKKSLAVKILSFSLNFAYQPRGSQRQPAHRSEWRLRCAPSKSEMSPFLPSERVRSWYAKLGPEW